MDTNMVDNNMDRESWRVTIERLYGDVSDLFQREGQLIRAELNEKATDIKVAGGELVTGGVVLFVGMLCVAASAIILLDLVAPLWAAALIVTAVFLVVGGILLVSAKNKMTARSFKPTRSLDAMNVLGHSLKEKVNEITKH